MSRAQGVIRWNPETLMLLFRPMISASYRGIGSHGLRRCRKPAVAELTMYTAERGKLLLATPI
jgi:hypothetical protein